LISALTIRNIGVISSAELQLSSGFTALTGETGAGKTMVLTALGLLMGERADAGRVRTGEKQLFVEGFSLRVALNSKTKRSQKSLRSWAPK